MTDRMVKTKMQVLKGALVAALLTGLVPRVGAERLETKLDGNDWTLDGLPVLVPNAWNKRDGADGDPVETVVAKTFIPSVPVQTYARRSGLYARALPDAKEGRRYFIRCEGASQTATVRVNGVMIGVHKGAFTEFAFEATQAMKPAGNRLEIEVSNAFDPDVPPISGDFTLCGGLYRSVWLVETDPVCIDPTIDGGPGVRVFPSMDGTVRVEADVSGADDAVVDWEPKKVDGFKLWSPEEPNVYTVRVTVRKGAWSDTVEQPFGFRTAEIRPDGFYLNGVKRKVRGVNRHQDLEGMGWEQTPEQEERDFRLIKAMGADGVRLAHYPQSENVYNVCDRLGLMVWSEIPVVDWIGGAAFRANARRMMREMVAQRRNHPSVCWWGCWNEIYNCVPADSLPEPGDWEREVSGLTSLTAALDATRPIVAATCRRDCVELNATIPNFCINIYPEWYSKRPMKTLLEEISKDAVVAGKAFALSEYGAGGSVYMHANKPVRPKKPTDAFHPEEYMTQVHVNDLRGIRDCDRVWGTFVWAMFDFAADGRREGDHLGVNDKGLVTRDRVTAKDAYFLYKANWNTEPLLYLCSRRMTSTDDPAARVVAFSNVGAVTLFVNGEKIGTQTPDDVRMVVFDDVRLSPGANEIRIEAGGLVDTCRWTLAGATRCGDRADAAIGDDVK